MDTPSEQTIYCDESGFTGNDLFSPDQPYFVYSSVCISPLEAKDVVEKVTKDFKLFNYSELKGGKLLKSPNGRAAISWILENYSDNALVMAFDKKYALAAKFYEYVFEPVLAENNLLFYNVGFHRFISSVLYLHFITGNVHTESILLDFQAVMRSKDVDKLENVLQTMNANSQLADFLRQILIFATYHKKTIADELISLRENKNTGNWILELTITALYNLLTKWGETIDQMDVYCDDSKPLVSQADFFDVMINRKERLHYEMGGKTHPITFNLSRPIQLGNSEQYHGIQIADVFASSIAYALKNKNKDKFSQDCLETCYKSIHENSIFPQLEYADLSTRDGYVNVMILTELLERTQNGRDVLDGMPDYIYYVHQTFPAWLEHNNFDRFQEKGS